MTGFVPPSSEPSTLYAGDLWAWFREIPGYPNATYTLRYHLDGGTAITDIAATATAGTDTNYTISVPATTTAPYTAGTYKYIARVTAGAEIHTLYEGVFLVRPNRATTSAAKTHNEIMLAAIEALLEGRAVSDLESYSIAGRALNKIPFAQLWNYRGAYRQAVWRERNLLVPEPSILVSFGGLTAVPLGTWRP